MTDRIVVDACVPGAPENYEKNRAAAIDMGFDPERVYQDLETALHREKGRSQFFIVNTPNNLHTPQCCAIAEHGYHFIVDKPLARNLKEADEIVEAVKRNGVKTCITPSWTFVAPNVEAQYRIAGQGLGKDILGGRFLYDQVWLKKKLEDITPEEGRKEALWRATVETSGEAGALGDIGSHELFQLHIISGLRIPVVRAFRWFVVQGRQEGKRTDDRALFVATLENGADVTCEVTQFAGGHGNDNHWELWLKDGLSFGWSQQEPEVLWCTDNEDRARMELINFKAPILKVTDTMPARHGDRWNEAEKRLVSSFVWSIKGKSPGGVQPFHPDVLVGRNINAILEAAVESADAGTPGKPVKVDWRDN
jgi:predicted dehydrogenase